MKIIITESQYNRLLESRPISQMKSRQTIVNAILGATHEITSHIYHDDYWHGVKDIYDVLDGMGLEYDVTVPNGGYRKTRDGEVKIYHFTFDITNDFGKSFPLEFDLVASQAGSVEDPWDRYDLTFYPTN